MASATPRARTVSTSQPWAIGGVRYDFMMRLSTTDRFGALPTPVRSSGMWATPWRIAWRAEAFAMSRPLIRMRPVHARSPVITSASSLCPLPAIAAIPTISPLRIVKDAPRSAGSSRSLTASTSLTSRTVSPSRAGVRSTVSMTSRPTISRARPARVDPAAGIPAAVTLPRRMTVIRSAIASTSPSLWLMNATLRPPAVIDRSVRNSSSISCGARTAVGSSMIRIRAPR